MDASTRANTTPTSTRTASVRSRSSNLPAGARLCPGPYAGTAVMIPDSRTRRRIADRFRRRGDRIYIHGKLATDPVYDAAARAIAGRPLPLLDIGCGLGLLGHYLHSCGALDEYIGLDHD